MKRAELHLCQTHAAEEGERWLFTLEWALVKVLHENRFTWGATFSNAVDLHHFEL